MSVWRGLREGAWVSGLVVDTRYIRLKNTFLGDGIATQHMRKSRSGFPERDRMVKFGMKPPKGDRSPRGYHD